ncbi:MAG: hypothetical protein JOZ47_03780 [Kutzneria sp.]|nr:hypothetical protein [Kutzneria sp.]MBV9844181.1 hypothetical protein [Kutzneria sp.]
MSVNWAALGEVFLVGLGAVASVVVMFSVGIKGISRRVVTRASGGTGSAGLVVAVSCFATCTFTVLCGLYLIVSH